MRIKRRLKCGENKKRKDSRGGVRKVKMIKIIKRKKMK
jgi:hypothetical protein